MTHLWVFTLFALTFTAGVALAEPPPTATASSAEEPRELTEEEQQLLKARQQQAQIRKIISAEPDPSLMLEPLPETPEDKRKKIPAKPQRPSGPPQRDTASQALGLGGALSSGLGASPTATAPTAGAATSAPAGLAVGAAPLAAAGFAGGATAAAKNAGSPRLGKLHAEALPSPEIAVILHNKQFFPSRLRIKAGVPTRVYFTSTSEKSAAIVVEQLQIQKWVAKEAGDRKPASSEYDRARFEVAREITRNRMTEIMFEPRRGTYSFHDAISGAKGQIVVE